MRYVVPVNAPDEVEALVAAGADELYCGFQEAWWVERYGDHDSASRRQGAANFSTREELALAAARAGECGVPLYLALNARYTEPQLDYLAALCSDFEHMGGTGVIVSDLGLLWRLRGVSKLRRCLSLLAVAQNAATLSAYRDLGIDRVVFPRFLKPDEAGSLLAAVPGVEAEVMAFFDKCPLVDGYCRHRHGVAYPDRPVEPERADVANAAEPAASGGTVGTAGMAGDAGETANAVEPERAEVTNTAEPADAAGASELAIAEGVGGTKPTAAEDLNGAAPLYTFDTTYRTHACLGTACDYLDPYPCAACYLPAFARAGVGYAKIGGRGRSLEERLRALAFLKHAETLGDDGSRQAYYQDVFGQSCSCYYGPHTQNRAAIEPIAPTMGDGGRVYLGSQTDYGAFRNAVEGMRKAEAGASAGRLTLLVPPLSNEGLMKFAAELPELFADCSGNTHLCVNDLGTLVTAMRVVAENGLDLRVTMGTLLARLDDPREVARFLSPDANPPRPVWGPDGEPRVLTYHRPPEPLVTHWSRPSATEPSAQAALSMLTGNPAVPFEFEA